MNTLTKTVIIVIVVLAAAIVFVIVRPRTSAPISTQPIATVLYSCDGGKSITAAYYQGTPAPTPAPGQPPTPTGSVSLSLSDGRAMTLPQTISADGARYANTDESFVFWEKGTSVLVQENSQEKSYTGCIAVAPNPSGFDLPQIYSNSTDGFSIRLPADYTINESYQYQELGPGKDINGVKFTISTSTAAGTNLASDSYVSVEEIPNVQNCTENLFLDQQGETSAAKTIIDNSTTYSVASSTGAAAGNRYEEIVYASPGTNPCVAVRYFIHYGVIENYPPGMVHEFDQQALLNQFDAIRRTLTIAP